MQLRKTVWGGVATTHPPPHVRARVKKALYTEFEPNRNTPESAAGQCDICCCLFDRRKENRFSSSWDLIWLHWRRWSSMSTAYFTATGAARLNLRNYWTDFLFSCTIRFNICDFIIHNKFHDLRSPMNGVQRIIMFWNDCAIFVEVYFLADFLFIHAICLSFIIPCDKESFSLSQDVGESGYGSDGRIVRATQISRKLVGIMPS